MGRLHQADREAIVTQMTTHYNQALKLKLQCKENSGLQIGKSLPALRSVDFSLNI